MNWSPPSDPVGATEHVGQQFCVWLNALLEAIRNQKMHPDAMESWPAPESSASATGVFGAAFLEAEQSPADSLRVTSGGSEGRLA